MKTITLREVSDSLLRKLEERAAVNQRTVEAEALSCLEVVIETEEELIGSIPGELWNDIEGSVCDSIHDIGMPLTDTDFKRYREIARGRKGS